MPNIRDDGRFKKSRIGTNVSQLPLRYQQPTFACRQPMVGNVALQVAFSNLPIILDFDDQPLFKCCHRQVATADRSA
jgi:hypothetical protein